MHGGGKKCRAEECQKWAQKGGYCTFHFVQFGPPPKPPRVAPPKVEVLESVPDVKFSDQIGSDDDIAVV